MNLFKKKIFRCRHVMEKGGTYCSQCGEYVTAWGVVDQGCRKLDLCCLSEGDASWYASTHNKTFCIGCGKKSHEAVPIVSDMCHQYHCKDYACRVRTKITQEGDAI